MSEFIRDTLEKLGSFRTGNTPLRLLPRTLCGLLGFPGAMIVAYKDESKNPTGSSKARAVIQMLLAATRDGKLSKGTEVVDASSGNTGKAITAAASSCGLHSTIFVPGSASKAKIELIERPALATVIRVAGSSEDARRAAQAYTSAPRAKEGDVFYLDQYNNPNNLQAHRLTTGPELLRQTQGAVTHVFAGIGTGATASGLASFFSGSPTSVIGVQPAKANHLLHGLKYLPGLPPDLVPGNARLDYLADNIFVEDEEAYRALELLVRYGLRFGPSSGAVVAAAARWSSAHRISTAFFALVFPDSLDLYEEELPDLVTGRVAVQPLQAVGKS